MSLGYLVDETDRKRDIKPLFEASMELCEPDIIFRPSLDTKMQNNFYDICLGLVQDIFHMGALVPRVANSVDSKDYLGTVTFHPELVGLKDQFILNVKLVMERANTKMATYLEYSYLWTESRHDTMYFFLNFGRQLTDEELQLLDEDESQVKKADPTLIQFKERIDRYEAVYEKVKEIDTSKVFNSWFRADMTPFKLALQNCVKKWSYLYKRHLIDYVKDNLADLNKFIEDADEGLMTQVHEGDYKNLIKVMKFLQLVKEKEKMTDNLFGPLQDIIDLLRSYGVELPQVIIM